MAPCIFLVLPDSTVSEIDMMMDFVYTITTVVDTLEELQ